MDSRQRDPSVRRKGGPPTQRPEFESEDEEREFLKTILERRYPYPDSFYEKLPTRRLWAMNSRKLGGRTKRKAAQAPNAVPSVTQSDPDGPWPPMPGQPGYEPIYARIDGESHILADSGEYVRIDG
jgi:hypothetical protein